ncbi:site-specific integrase [Streptomyces cyaneochromogenes]|uniref:Site-specific integrase n=1 Tax=Streptomyces cyaneochromogenes TaxID=2496836 RepID=A0A3S9MEV2_9ACTN|nr:tyrosine-type recombinase/integrase [Streptomyces cyaneochromogenes]AZQ37699.1 site-specific integrase [Streptomyces cyaneochromogenes]
MTAQPLTLTVSSAAKTRTVSDRLEILHALIAAPTFDPVFRDDVIQVAPDHPVYGWNCRVPGCERSRNAFLDFCGEHTAEWNAVQRVGNGIVEFLSKAQPLKVRGGRNLDSCVICSHAPAYSGDGLCFLHAGNLVKWRSRQRRQGKPCDFELWADDQLPYPDFGQCKVVACGRAGAHWIGLCHHHLERYRREGSPGGAEKVRNWGKRSRELSLPVAVTYTDQVLFRRWCTQSEPIGRMDGMLSLLGLRPLVRAEIKWTLFHHAQSPEEGARWCLNIVQQLATQCRRQDVNSLADLDLEQCPQHPSKVAQRMLHHLRVVYFSRQDTKDAGYIETAHYGVRLTNHGSYVDISNVSQRWLRDLLWDWMDTRLTTDPPRSRQPFDRTRRGCVELSAYLEAQAPGGGHDPTMLTKDHMVGFVADQRHRAEHGLKPLGVHHTVRRRGPQAAADVTKLQVSRIFGGARLILRNALDSGEAQRIGLDRIFIVTLPHGGGGKAGRRRPFSDEVARALANEQNLKCLDEMDLEDRGLRDSWEAIVTTGRRASEVLELRLECIGRYKNLPLLWHDQTKVGNVDEGIRISERLYQRIQARQAKTVARFAQRHGRQPADAERRTLALFPRRTTNRTFVKSVSYGWYRTLFSEWVSTLNIGHSVSHQARHTLATNLLKAGANLTHVKRYLGQVSDAMAEHYVHLANTDPMLDQALQAIWVAGPGAAQPGLILSEGEPMSREEAEALAIDLTRRSTPAEGGFCTFQHVVDGNACPWNLDCHNCDKFVMSGADLVYWHRKRDQWRTLAERAPDPKVADYLHELFEPTARAIAGLERALEAVGLLDEALALDLRRPQDYFGRVWATAFRAEELARHADLQATDNEYGTDHIDDAEDNEDSA